MLYIVYDAVMTSFISSSPLGPVSSTNSRDPGNLQLTFHQVVRRVTRNDKIMRSIRIVGIRFA